MFKCWLLILNTGTIIKSFYKRQDLLVCRSLLPIIFCRMSFVKVTMKWSDRKYFICNRRWSKSTAVVKAVAPAHRQSVGGTPRTHGSRWRAVEPLPFHHSTICDLAGASVSCWDRLDLKNKLLLHILDCQEVPATAIIHR